MYKIIKIDILVIQTMYCFLPSPSDKIGASVSSMKCIKLSVIPVGTAVEGVTATVTGLDVLPVEWPFWLVVVVGIALVESRDETNAVV